MKDHWQELLAVLDYKNGETILDVGGGMDPCPVADMIIDVANYGMGGKAYTLLDLCCDTFPFPDKSFDICICSQTLEDLACPRIAIREMSRVAKRGIIEVPHRGPESLRTSYNDLIQKPPYAEAVDVWCYGTEHHKWLIEDLNNVLTFVQKNMIYLMLHPIPKWRGGSGIRFKWQNTIEYNIAYDIDPFFMHNNYYEFRERSRKFWQ